MKFSWSELKCALNQGNLFDDSASDIICGAPGSRHTRQVETNLRRLKLYYEWK